MADNDYRKVALQEVETALESEATSRATAISAAIDNLVDSSPGTLDTLNELAAALGDYAHVSTTITGLINDNQTHIDNGWSLSGDDNDENGIGWTTRVKIEDRARRKEG